MLDILSIYSRHAGIKQGLFYKLQPTQSFVSSSFTIYHFQIIISIDLGMKSMIKLVCVVICLKMAIGGRFAVQLKDWQFRLQNGATFYPATIPSSLALDLIDNKLVKSDPYFRDNFLDFYKFETVGATYKTSFNISPNVMNSKYQVLMFEGLDTHCDVYLNDAHILSAHNMFRTYEVPVKFNKTNDLIIHFNSSATYDIQKAKQFTSEHGFSLPQNYSFTRKAAYQYGWDWGPRILSLGIWKDITVHLYNQSRIHNLVLKHSQIQKNIKIINCNVKLDVSELNQNNTYQLEVSVVKKSNNFSLFLESIIIKSTLSASYVFQFNITKDIWDVVWWTWDLGTPNLLEVKSRLTNLNRTQALQQSIITGIRSVNVTQESNKTTNGTSFSFNLNGYDVYMRGGNYIPPEMSIARTNRKTYEQVRDQALFARFNMLRLWGGGQFEKDEFYDVLDEAGILIWHDLMFACALYPSSPEILDNIEAEMRDNLKRIRRHPSIALWNGNNEIWIGWQEWGWKDSLNQTQKQLVQKMYDDIFRKLLPKVISEQHGEIFYWETSPSVSSNTVKTIVSGDIHFWRVWGGKAAIEEYEDYVGRFNSQYGMQSMPEWSSLLQFTLPQDREINSAVMRLHQRHPKGDEFLPFYTLNYSGNTTNLTRYAYFSQVMQAYALEMAITSLRLNKPYNMGSLYWQLNDVWPVSSWATVDYYGMYKAAHYRVRQAYQQLIIHTLHQKSTADYSTYIVNDYNKTFHCHSVLTIMTFTGEPTKVKHTVEKTVKPFQRVLVHKFNKNQYSSYLNNSYIRMEMRTAEDNISSVNNFYFQPMKSRLNAPSGLALIFNGSKIHVSAKKLATYVWIYRMRNGVQVGLKLEDNYFTLNPNEQRVVELGDAPVSEIYVTCFEDQINAEKKLFLHPNQSLQTE